MTPSEYLNLASRISLVAASVAAAYGVSLNDILSPPLNKPRATLARTQAMAVASDIFAPSHAQAIGALFRTTEATVHDAIKISKARREMDDYEHQTYRLLVASAMSILAPAPNYSDESIEADVESSAFRKMHGGEGW